jgi:hypothetical protein
VVPELIELTAADKTPSFPGRINLGWTSALVHPQLAVTCVTLNALAPILRIRNSSFTGSSVELVSIEISEGSTAARGPSGREPQPLKEMTINKRRPLFAQGQVRIFIEFLIG